MNELYDDHAEMLRAQAVNAIYTALGKNVINVYGNQPFEFSGVILPANNRLTLVTHFAIVEGTVTKVYRYETDVKVTVTRHVITEKL